MPKVISIHEYELKPGVNHQEFEQAYRKAKADGLFNLPGLEVCYLVRGIKGRRREAYAAIWVYASQESWECTWGPVGSRRGRSEYPPGWLTWEEEVLSQFLEGHADDIRLTSYLSVS